MFSERLTRVILEEMKHSYLHSSQKLRFGMMLERTPDIFSEMISTSKSEEKGKFTNS